jgi:hypothetical protein
MRFVPRLRLPEAVVWPSEANEPVKALAISVSVELAHVELIVVPVTTGLPTGRLYVPDPFLLIYCSS